MAPDYHGGKFEVYIKKREEEGRLVLGFIKGGLTSILKFCDICAKNYFKSLINKLYMKWKSKFLKSDI